MAQLDLGDLSRNTWDQLNGFAIKIICTDGGVAMPDLASEQFQTPVNNALAGHAYAVLKRELLKISPDYQDVFGQIESDVRDNRPDPPDR